MLSDSFPHTTRLGLYSQLKFRYVKAIEIEPVIINDQIGLPRESTFAINSGIRRWCDRALRILDAT